MTRSATIWCRLSHAAALRRNATHDSLVSSGTTATHGMRVIGGADPASQTHFVLDKIEGALQSLGAELDDVIRTRIYVRHADEWEPVSRAHGARLGHVAPANTLVRADLIGDEYRVEIEAEALLPED